MSFSEERRKITGAALVVSLATLGGRVVGFARDLVVAFIFGVSAETDAFLVAFRIPNLLRRLFAEGALSVAFIPVFTEVLRRKGAQEAAYLLRNTLSMLAMVLLAGSALGVLFAPQIITAVAPGFRARPETFALAVDLTRWCLPYVFFISLAALAGGALNSQEHFFAPAISPVVLNLSIIACALALSPLIDPPITALAVGVLLGGAAQLMVQIPFLRARGMSLWPAWKPRDPDLRRMLGLMAPAALGAAVYQATILANTILASLLPTGSVSYLYYAERLIEFPIGLCAIGITTAILPSLSRQAADKDMPGLLDTLTFGLRIISFAVMPAMVGILVLAEPLITLLFLRGRFTPHDVEQTVRAIVGYGVGIWAFSAGRTVASVFFALQETRIPVLVAGGCMVVNVAAAVLLIGPLGHAGLALASSIAAIANLLGLLWMLRRRLGPLGMRRNLAFVIRCAGLSLLMAAVAWAVAYLPDWEAAGRVWHTLARPLAAIVAGGLSYLAGAAALGMLELRAALDMLRSRKQGGRRGLRPGRKAGPPGGEDCGSQ